MAGEIGASIISSGSNLIANERSFAMQKELNRRRYTDYINFMHQVGATPNALVQGMAGSGTGSIPVASSAGNPVSDFGQSMAAGVSANAAQKQAAAAQDNANAALTNAETERQLALMKLKFEPAKYFADIRKSLAQAFESTKNAFLHGSMKSYYDELTRDVQQIRPWKIAGLKQGLLNDMATFGKIMQETRTSKALEGYYKAGAEELGTRSDLNRADTYLKSVQGMNENLRGFRIQWENTLLSYGIDPTKPFWDNTARLMYTNPVLFKQRMDMFISSLNSVDNKIQENLGENYKRNVAAGIGLYKLNQLHQSNANARSFRNSNALRAVSSLIPFLRAGSAVGAAATEEPLFPWGSYWSSDTYKNRWNDWLKE